MSNTTTKYFSSTYGGTISKEINEYANENKLTITSITYLGSKEVQGNYEQYKEFNIGVIVIFTKPDVYKQ